MPPPDDATQVPVSALGELLAASLGQEKAAATVEAAVADLGLAGPDLTPKDAYTVLEHISASPGIVGTVARFAKARFILLYPVD